MVTINSQGVTEILVPYWIPKFDFPPHFLKGLMHSFPMMYNTMGSTFYCLAGRGQFLNKKCLKKGSLGGDESGQPETHPIKQSLTLDMIAYLAPIPGQLYFQIYTGLRFHWCLDVPDFRKNQKTVRICT